MNLQTAEAWATIGGFILILVGSVVGLSKWNSNRIDKRVLDYMEEHARKHSDGSRSRSLADIVQELGMSRNVY